MANVRTIEQLLSLSIAADRFYTVFFAAFTALALVLATIGIYGVMSFGVAQRAHEIGLRMTLGARQRAGVPPRRAARRHADASREDGLGAVGATLVGRALAGAVYGVETINPLTLSRWR